MMDSVNCLKKKFLMDNLANLFSIIQNGQNRHKIVVQIPFSKRSWNICNVLFIEGLLKGFLFKENSIYIFLKYSQNKPVIKKIEKLSLQGRRLYTKKGISTESMSTNNQNQFAFNKICKNLNGVIDNVDSDLSLSTSTIYELASPIESNFMKKQENSIFFKLRLLSTSQGIMTERDSKFLQIGGELLCEIS